MTSKSQWERILMDMQRPMPIQYQSQFNKNIHRMPMSEFLAYLNRCKNIDRRWRRDVFLRFRISYFYIWTHLIFGFCATVAMVSEMLGVVVGFLGVVLGIGCFISGFASIAGLLSFTGEGIVIGLIGIVATLVIAIIANLILGIGTGLRGWAQDLLDHIRSYGGIDTIIFQRDWTRFGTTLLVLCGFICISIWFQDLYPDFYVHETVVGFHVIALCFGLIFFRIPRHEERSINR